MISYVSISGTAAIILFELYSFTMGKTNILSLNKIYLHNLF